MTPNAKNSWLVRSDDLHSRVQKFIQSESQSPEEFEALALNIARFQADHIPGYSRLVQANASGLDTIDTLPAVPVEAFRLTRIAAHPPEADVARYVTSGTTTGRPGTHAMRRTDTYRTSAVTWGRRALLPAGTLRAAVVALLPISSSSSSSLAAMARMFMEVFDPSQDNSEVRSELATRWLLTARDVDISGLAAHLERARDAKLPLLLVATAFGLVHLLDELGERRLDIWPHTIVMPTGGFKGKSREISADELRRRTAVAFGIDLRHIVGEYGMTELSSQLYEGCLPHGKLAANGGIYLPPPWLSVCPVDPETMRPVQGDALGIARFTDLANVDSAVCVVTQDVIRRKGNGIELQGRWRGAPARGCSLSTEEWVASDVKL